MFAERLVGIAAAMIWAMSICWTSVALAQPAQPQAGTELQPPASSGSRHLVILAGLPGDGDYRERIAEAVRQLVAMAPERLNVTPDKIHLFLSDETMHGAVQIPEVERAVCNLSNVRNFFAMTAAQWSADDSMWLVMMGHTQTIDGRNCFHVQGRDFTAKELSEWLKPVPCRQQVNFLTMPGSGGWLSPLKAVGRVNIAATDSLAEYTATEYPYALVRVLTGQQSHQALEDLDADGRLSLLDLYLAVALEVDHHYRSEDHLATEHALLDDNGDGNGQELQEPLMPVEKPEDQSEETLNQSASPAPRVKLAITQNGDGAVARSITIRAAKSR